MSENNMGRIARRIVVSTFAACAMAGAAHADWSNPYGEAGISASGYFSNFGSGGKAPEFDASHYDRIQLGSLSSVLWAPKRGAQGPMRDEGSSKMAMQYEDLNRRLGPIGGHNTP